MSCHLRGRSILVTRPAAQAEALCALIEQAHGRPVRFPVMEIQPLNDSAPARAVLGQLKSGDMLIFVSVNAVRHAFVLMPDELPLDLRIAAIGQATARALEELGLAPTLVPGQRYNSEALLALPELRDMSGQHVVIVRGQGGREKLRQTLQERGAQVAYAEVYRRVLPRRSAANLIRGWDKLVDIVTLTSGQMLDNLLKLLGDEGLTLLRRTPVLVVSERIAERAYEMGLRKLWISERASDQAILETLCEMVEQES